MKTSKELNSKLGIGLVMRKDYKNFKFSDQLLGISSIDLEIGDLITTQHETLQQEMKKIIAEKSLDAFIILAAFKPDSTSFRR